MGDLLRHRPGLLMGVPRRLLAVAWIALVVPAASSAQIIDRVLATVGGQAITLSDARAAIALGLVRSESGPDPIGPALSDLVVRALILTDVNRYAAPPPEPEAVERRLSEVRARFPSDAAYREALEANAMTEARLRDVVRDDLRIDAYLDQRFSAPAQPTDDEVARYYETHQAEFVREGRLPALDDVRDLARERTVAGRRRTLIEDWVDRLRLRTDVTVVMGP
ncbi:MAG: hypothetical protein IMZ71_03960, partial [Chloroflexi bacterium]|nr:hypothetical protein [Chloroflexota bacterium]